jgi:hypothetical protein
MIHEPFVFTPENLIENIKKIGPWSAFGLAEEAMFYYFPHIKRMRDTGKQIAEMARISTLFSMYWKDWIIKYQKEVGYNAPNGFDTGCVNEF